MPYLLNFVYLALIVLAFPWLLYQRLRHGKYREGWPEKFLGRVPSRHGNKPCVWFHAVSVGEVNLLEPILKRWERMNPGWEIVISTTTQAGYQLAKKRFAHHTVTYCPLDFSWAVRQAVERIRPDLLVLAELEIWPNLIAAARRHGAKVAVINGRLSEKSFRGYRGITWLLGGVLKEIDLIAVQNDEYARRFLALGARQNAVQVTGSIKFDGARSNRDTDEIRRLAQLAEIQDDDVVFLAGSTQQPEEAIALSVFEKLAADFPRLRLILVPRHPERFDEVAGLLVARGVAYARRSQLTTSHCPRVFLVDAVGELGHWWGTAHIAFVGGSLTQRGGQNMIEPAAYGAAISFGPNTWNFRDVVTLLIDSEAAVVVRNQLELEAFVRHCVLNPEDARCLGRRAQDVVQSQQGATDRTIELLSRLASQQPILERIKSAA